MDLLICHTATYATSSQVLPIVQRAKVPVLVLNLQPVAAPTTKTPTPANGWPTAPPVVS
ncbi:MAG: hypothetical protein R2856_32205 [Caldilineaceae bacterium]